MSAASWIDEHTGKLSCGMFSVSSLLSSCEEDLLVGMTSGSSFGECLAIGILSELDYSCLVCLEDDIKTVL